MNGYVLATMVEGHAEVDALPLLVRRLHPGLIVPKPVRVKRQKVLQHDELLRTATFAESNIRQGGGSGGILLLLDADSDCAATIGPDLQRRLSESFSHRMVRCVFAVREFESWLVAGDPTADEAADETRGGKGWLKHQLGMYSPTADQPRLTAALDVARAEKRSRSFRRLRKVLAEFAARAEFDAGGS